MPPFLATFLISLFVLVLQFFWNYIDDILGKGVGFFYFVEFLFYLSITFLPLSLPLGVLLSSVMVLGNMAEKHELTSVKSAGIPLLRSMRPLILLCFLIAGLSFFSNNNLIPYANLKKYSRLYDLKKSKPTMSIDAGVFNDDFTDMSIYVDEKDKRTQKLTGVKIYDHSESREYALVTADSGYMEVENETNRMRMTLYNGHQYKEEFSSGKSSRKYPFVRMKFDKWQRYLDLSEFEVDKTDENLFRGNQKIMKSGELIRSIDSLNIEKVDRENEFSDYVKGMFGEALNADTTIQIQNKDEKENAITIFRLNQSPIDCMNTGNRFIDDFAFEDHSALINRALSKVNSVISQSSNTQERWTYKNEKLVKHISELHQKFSLAFTCLLFLFIGAPMGAIIRKGGYGYPLLVAIIFFVLYIVLSTYFRKLAESFQIDASIAAWMPNIILFPIGIFLTIKAMNDSKFLSMKLSLSFLKKLFVRHEQ